MKLLIFGGTSDARRLIQALPAQHEATFCVVSQYARHLLPQESERLRILVGAKSGDEIASLMEQHDLVIDATHPYAANIRQTLQQVVPGEKYRRLIRRLPETAGFSDYAAMVDYLTDKPGNILVTTGVRSAQAFSALSDRVWLRLLPDPDNLSAAIAAGLKPSQLIAMQGPFSENFNRVVMEDLAIRFLVTKASGQAGGFAEKVAAARALDIEVLILAPPHDDGLSLAELIEELERL